MDQGDRIIFPAYSIRISAVPLVAADQRKSVETDLPSSTVLHPIAFSCVHLR